ncbi:MAG TPA: FAD-dependent oxidoreductase [Smithella sp.]|nr:FAD-dependent oxidoreductase [Smithella sp.]MDM7988248.1 FAD-dependent oxidoreductase [Smithella sp.]HNY51236.1 FAD-dependent oxidoreductase [Smithella sp.]HOG91354.1 FAD-dependent oxidoreductase [Smithella sp.]HOU51971.1 FAD-dependent oxidoreductase [Smithella sp.]
MIKTDVIIIGGGATGCGIARDLALRGISHCLVEKGDFAAGATGACHGLLHSGGRYAVTDPVAARECYEENLILRRIGKKCVEQTGGLFVRLPGDSKRFREVFLRGCEAVGIPAEVLSASKALELVPNLNPQIEEAIKVPDCSIDPFRLCMLNIRTSELRGGIIFTRHKVTEIIKSHGRCTGIKAIDQSTGETREIHGNIIINATGAWANMVAALAGSEVPMTLVKGSLVITNHRLTNMVINRLRQPSDGDIIVPNEAVCLAGTTSLAIEDPDNLIMESPEVDTIISEAGRMIPHFNATRIIRAFSGVRPLLKSKKADSHEISRGFQIINHENGLYSIVGGKLSTFRLMAEKMVDTIMALLNLKKPCETAEIPLDGQEELSGYPLAKRLTNMKNIVCECELVTRSDVERIIRQTSTRKVGDIQHRTRLGMGPCQGGFCTFRALGIMNDMSVISPEQSMEMLRGFLQRRYKGIRHALWGDQLREEQLVEYIYLGILAMEQSE